VTAWHIEARKYDQRLHYRMPVRLIDDDGERLRFHAPPGTPIDHITRGRKYSMEYASDMFFWRERWYNVYVNRQPDGAVHYFYCNVGLPPVIRDTTLSFVDLDLDVEMYPNGSFHVVDVGEFRAHSLEFGYPPEVRRAACKAMRDVVSEWRARRPPFDQL
jgi:protein associated with RNAse G/E